MTMRPRSGCGAKTAERLPIDDGVAAVADAVPLVEQLALREAAVQHRDLPREALGEAAHGLRRERDLRYEDDAALAQRQRGSSAAR